jgi:hypothetical protein
LARVSERSATFWLSRHYQRPTTCAATSQAGPDKLAADPPNATLSLVKPGKDKNAVADGEISQPVVDGDDR